MPSRKLQRPLRLYPAERVPRRSRYWQNILFAPPRSGVTDEARAHVKLKGRVQGVGFRFATADQARALGLNGWVRNLASGGVEAVFEGPRSRVVDMVRWCEDGPPGAYVR